MSSRMSKVIRSRLVQGGAIGAAVAMVALAFAAGITPHAGASTASACPPPPTTTTSSTSTSTTSTSSTSTSSTSTSSTTTPATTSTTLPTTSTTLPTTTTSSTSTTVPTTTTSSTTTSTSTTSTTLPITTTTSSTTTSSTSTSTSSTSTSSTSTSSTTSSTLLGSGLTAQDSPVEAQAALSTHCVGIVTGLGAGPHIRIVNPNNLGNDLSNFDVDPTSYTGPQYVAAADINGDGNADVAVGRNGVVKLRDAGGANLAQDIYPYGTSFQGEIRVALADLDGDNKADLITAPGPGGGPHIRAFKFNSGTASMDPVSGPMGNGIMAYDPGFTGGVYVAGADLNADNHAEIVTGAGPGGGPHVRAFNANGSKAAGQIGDGFYAYGPDFKGGARVAAAVVDGAPLIVTGAGPGGGPHVREFTVTNGGQPQPLSGQAGSGWYAYGQNFSGGVFVAIGDIDSDNAAEVITGAGAGGGPHVRAFNHDTSQVDGPVGSGYMATTPTFTGGVTVAAGKV